jgi:hypothetical protein
MRRSTDQLRVITRVCFVLVCALLALAHVCAAQSNAPDAPTPVTTNEISGSIAPLDVGDPRQTRHFYTFSARPGDLELTIEASNLEGDIDLFSSAAMRPLAKVTLYAGINATVSRTVFFRREETVILRIQARSANDADGTYRIHLGGTFVASTAIAPVQSSSAEIAKSSATNARPADRNVRRVNSVGARIEEPKVEVAETPAPTPGATANAPVAAKTPTTGTTPARSRAATRRSTARTGATQQNSTQPAATTGDTANTSTTNNSDRNTANSPTKNATGNDAARATTTRTNAARNRASRPRTPRTSTNGSDSPSTTATPSEATPKEPGSNAATATPATAVGLEAPGSRIVLELRDGTRVVREMSEVRRVAIEGRLVVIVLKNGRVERQPLANVQRMSIEP